MKRILVVDDSVTVRQQVAQTLQQAGYEVVEATDGVDALTKVDPTIAMAICDVNMPRMNGIELVEKLAQDPTWKLLPIVMLTTEGQPQLIQRARAAGIKGWIVKPFKPEMLVAVVKKMAA